MRRSGGTAHREGLETAAPRAACRRVRRLQQHLRDGSESAAARIDRMRRTSRTGQRRGCARLSAIGAADGEGLMRTTRPQYREGATQRAMLRQHRAATQRRSVQRLIMHSYAERREVDVRAVERDGERPGRRDLRRQPEPDGPALRRRHVQLQRKRPLRSAAAMRPRRRLAHALPYIASPAIYSLSYRPALGLAGPLGSGSGPARARPAGSRAPCT